MRTTPGRSVPMNSTVKPGAAPEPGAIGRHAVGVMRPVRVSIRRWRVRKDCAPAAADTAQIAAELLRVVQLRECPLEPGLGRLEGLGRALVVPGAVLLDEQVAIDE
jgi:hypothetical protein